MIRVCVVDDHPALRTGLSTVIRSEIGMEFAGAATRPDEAVDLVERVRPDVILVDYQLPGEDGIALCQRLKDLRHPPKVVVYSAYSDSVLALPAVLAGADGVTNKAALADHLLDTIRRVARGRTAIPPISGALVEATAAKLGPADVFIFRMLMAHASRQEIAESIGIEERELGARLRAIVSKLRVEKPKVEIGL
jgi:DNA-binding NarL/FixJ family response regulator